MTNVVYPTPTQQARYDAQAPAESGHLPCRNCGERAEDHERRTIGLTELYLCEDGAQALDEFLDDKSIQFAELDEEEAREDARLRAAGL